MRSLFTSLILLLCATTAFAQRVYWSTEDNFLEIGQVNSLALVFDSCEPEGEITLPPVANLQFGSSQRGEQSNTTFVNGRMTQEKRVYFAYPVRPQDRNQVTIPPFSVQTTTGTMQVAGMTFEVREATVGNTAIPVATAANSILSIGSGQIWAGEVVPVNYTLSVSPRFRASLASQPEWDPTPLVVEEFPEQPTQSTNTVNGENRVQVTYQTRGYFRTDGVYAVPSAQQVVNISVPTNSFFNLNTEQYSITSNSPQVVVRPLPSPAPATFNGAVGDFELTSTVVPERATVGEPVTWTLALTGTGNWPDINALPARDVSVDFRLVQPQASRDIPEGKLFEGRISEDVVLIPTRPGSYQIGPVTWTYFNPSTGRYQEVTCPAVTLEVAPGAAPSPSTQPQPAGGNSNPNLPSGDFEPATSTAVPTAAAPNAIVRDPLSGADQARSPISRLQVLMVASGIVLLLPLVWLALAWQHARRTDPGRAARAARRALHVTLRELAGGTTPELLLRWQQQTATLWQTRHAAPNVGLFGADDAWSRLWREADRALYGDDVKTLPADWLTRAQAALAAKRAPRFPVFSVLAPRNLLPLVAMAALFLTAAPTVDADALQDYATGDFEAAEAAWQTTVTATPTDWIAHHNLALTLAQQQRWAEAGAHAAVAFAQHPSDASVRWHLGYTLERSGFAPPVFRDFMAPGWRQLLARSASPARWQLALLGGLLLGIVALSLVLLHTYGRRLPLWRFLAWTLGLGGVVLMAAAALSLQTWGLVANPQAVLTWQPTELRSIPTDLNEEQQTTPLAAGSLARVERRFLGWRQLAFPNGQTGWVRQETVVPLWVRQE